VLTFASFGEGGTSRLFCLDVLAPVQRVQRAEERTRTAFLLITSVRSVVAEHCTGLQTTHNYAVVVPRIAHYCRVLRPG
jgi:hypothetical protein